MELNGNHGFLGGDVNRPSVANRKSYADQGCPLGAGPTNPGCKTSVRLMEYSLSGWFPPSDVDVGLQTP